MAEKLNLPKIALGKLLKGLPQESYFISDKFTPQCADSNSASSVADMLKTEYANLEGKTVYTFFTSGGSEIG